jgi:benzoate/toluate 1,2-dioxygenase alpha subunit
VHRGFVYASLWADVPPLIEHLGESATFLDITCEPAPQALEVVGAPVSYVLRANWKLVHENAADSYHAATVHRNYGTAIKRQVQQGGLAVTGGRFMLKKKVASGTYDLGSGHGLFWAEREDPENFPIYARKDQLEREHSEGRLRWLLGRGRQLTVFPNLAVNDLLKATAFRSYRPLAVDATEVTIYCLAPVGESQDARRERLRHFETLFLPSSALHSDDIAVLELVQHSSRAWASPWTDLSRGMAFKTDGPNDAARDLGINPAQSSPDSWDDMAIQALYRRWAKVMGANNAS